MEPTSSDALFSLRPVVRVSSSEILFNEEDGIIFRGGSSFLRSSNRGTGVFDYTVVSGIDSSAVQSEGRRDAPIRIARNELNLLEVPRELHESLRPIVDRVLVDIPKEDVRARRGPWRPTYATPASSATAWSWASRTARSIRSPTS